MKYDDILEFQQSIRESQEEFAQNQNEGIKFMSVWFLPPSLRIGSGYRKLSEDNYRLELRVSKEDEAIAVPEAQKVVEKAKGEASIAVIQKLEIPSLSWFNIFTGSSSKTPLRDCKRPLIMGMSIGFQKGGAGTLGCFVNFKDKGKALLTAGHVLTNLDHNTNINERVYQPGRPDVRQYRVAEHSIAKLSDFTAVSPDDENEIDAGLALLDEGIEFEGNLLPSGVGCPPEDEGQIISDCADPQSLVVEDGRMAKIGRTTQYTEGNYGAGGFTRIPIDSPIGKLLFKNLIAVKWDDLNNSSFSQPGDSGSLVYRKSDKSAVGIIIAGGVESEPSGPRYGITYICPLKSILEQFDATLVV